MPTHDFDIANQNFPTTRADINGALAALASNSSNGTAPTSPTTYQTWLDTSGGATSLLWKMYDGTDWVTIGTLNATTNTFTPSNSELVNDLTPQLGGPLDPNSNYLGKAKGVDLASATALVIGTDGDYFDVTGTTTITSFTVSSNRLVFLQFDGALTLTHHATNLILPGAGDITTAAGDVGVFFSPAANQVRCVSYTRADGTSVATSGDNAGKLAKAMSLDTASADDTQTFTSSGTWTKPGSATDDSFVLVVAVGGGGGGGTCLYHTHKGLQ